MVTQLRVGMVLRLPSGNVIILLRRVRSEWLCEYTDQARARGQVLFTGAYLRRHADSA